MALPINLSSGNTFYWPFARHQRVIFYTGSKVYLVGVSGSGSSGATLKIISSSDPSSGFSDVTGTGPTTVAFCVAAYMKGTVIHIATCEDNGNGADVYYHAFDTSDDTWDTKDEAVYTGYTNVPSESRLNVDIALNADGDIAIFYMGEPDIYMDTPYTRADLAFKPSGGSWTTGIGVDGYTASNGYHASSITIVVTGNNRFVLWWAETTTRDSQVRVYKTDDTLGTNLELDNSIFSAVPFGFQGAVSYDSGGTKKVKGWYIDSDNSVDVQSHDDADNPSKSITAAITAYTVENRSGNLTHIARMFADETNKRVFFLYQDGVNDDLYFVDNTDDAGWQSETLVDGSPSAGFYNLTAAHYGTVIAYGYMVSAVAWYNEYSLAAGPVLKSVDGTVVSAGALAVKVLHSKAGTVASAGDVVKKTATTLDGPVATVGDVAALKLSTQSVDGIVAASGGVTKTPALIFDGAVPISGTVLKTPAKNLSGTAASVGAVTPIKTTLLSIGGTLASGGILVKKTLFSLAGAVASSAVLTKKVASSLAGSVAASGVLSKKAALSPSGAVASAGVVAAIKASLLSVAGTLTSSGAITKAPRINLAGTAAPAGAVVKQIRRTLAGTLTSSGVLTKLYAKSLAGTIASAGSVVAEALGVLAKVVKLTAIRMTTAVISALGMTTAKIDSQSSSTAKIDDQDMES